MDNSPSTACVCGEHRSANQVIPPAKTLAGISLWKEIGYNLPSLALCIMCHFESYTDDLCDLQGCQVICL